MKKKYRIYIITLKSMTIPNGYHWTTLTQYNFTQKGYKSDYDSYEEAETALMTEPEFQHSTATHTIQPVYSNEN